MMVFGRDAKPKATQALRGICYLVRPGRPAVPAQQLELGDGTVLSGYMALQAVEDSGWRGRW